MIAGVLIVGGIWAGAAAAFVPVWALVCRGARQFERSEAVQAHELKTLRQQRYAAITKEAQG